MADKKTGSSPKTSKSAKSRKLEAPTYRSFRLHKRITHTRGKLPGSFTLFRRAVSHLWKYRRLFLGIVAVYFLLTSLFVRGFAGSLDLPELKSTFDELFTGASGKVTTGLTLFGILVRTSGNSSSELAGAYQTILLVLVSLVIIWALRQTFAGHKVGVKESFYRSAYPLIPFLLVLSVIALQLLPLLAAGGLYQTVFGFGIAVTAIEKVLWVILLFLLALLSLYLVSSSVFALYIVTLPDVMPMQALRSARDLVRYRRWMIMRKVFILPVILLVIGAVIMLPTILLLTPVAETIFFALTMLALAVTHSYLYGLYRELL